MSTCEHVERDNAQCSVIVQIDFKKRFVSGQLNIGNNATIATLRTETKFQLQSSSVMATVWYTCAMLDYCDFEFLNELMIDNLANLNAISVQQKLIDLLYKSTSGPTDIPCTDGLCPSNSFCQADLENTVTSQYNYTFITSTLPCYYMSPNGNLLEIIQLSSHSAAQIAIMTLRCNREESLLDYAPRLQSLSISRNQSLPLQISLFKYRNVSVRYLNLKNYNYQFNEEECLRLNYSPLGVQCEVLFINVKNRESIMILVKNMINLRTLHIKCEDDKYSKHLSLTENVDESHNANTLNKDDLVQWLKDSLASTCLIVTNPDFANSISIWI
ncbi:unnamed protein product [Rotaria sp. Silwood1]|nr:unnamed protein product [Rotaria sp. Silwood1]